MITACGIDIGSNSFRLLVAEIRDGRLRPLLHDLVTVRLGEGLGASGFLAPAAINRGEAALARFSEKIARYPSARVRACATHALRIAANSRDFLLRIKERTGLSVEVLSGEEEARLALLGMLSGLPEEQRRYPLALVDVGGGSTEVIRQAAAGDDPRMISLPLGAAGLSEEFGADLTSMRKKIRATLDRALPAIAAGETGCPDSLLVASGGTATSLASLALGLKRYDARLLSNYQLSRTGLQTLVAGLAALSPRERNDLPGLGEGRGGIIVAGAMILQEALQALASPFLRVSDAGLLEGILLSGAATIR